MKRLLGIAIAITAVVAVLVVIRATDSAPAPVPSPVVDAPDPLAESRRARADRVPGTTGTQRVEVDPPAPGPAPPRVRSGVPVRGTIAVVDVDGGVHEHEDGALRVLFVDGRGGSGQAVAVTAGQWKVDVPPGRDLRIAGIELGGRKAVLADVPDRYRVEPGAVIDLRARWLRATMLHVVDAETGRELDGVTLVRAPGWPRGDLSHPGDVTADRVELRAGTSPIELPAEDSNYRTFHVHAPRHAWARVRLEPALGGDRFVELGPAGDLEIGLAGDVSNPGLVLRVRTANGLLHAEVDVAERRTITLDGLPAGECRVAAEIGDWWDNHHVLGEGRVTIVAGGRARVDLELSALEAPELVPFGGEIVLPSVWELDNFGLIVKLLDPPLLGQEEIVRLWRSQLTSVDPNTWRWHLDGVQPGRYELELHPLYSSISLDVGPRGREDVRFVLPPPGEVLIRVIDASTGRLADIEAVHWHAKWPEWVGGGGVARAERDPDTGLWRIRAPQCDIEISTGGGDYTNGEAEVRVTDLPREVTIEVEPGTRVILTLRDGTDPVPWPSGADVHVQAPAWDEPRKAWVSGGARVWLPVREPGIYTIRVGRLPGYEPVPEFELAVAGPGRVEHAIALFRSR